MTFTKILNLERKVLFLRFLPLKLFGGAWLLGGRWGGWYQQFVGSQIFWRETPGTRSLAETKALRSTWKVYKRFFHWRSLLGLPHTPHWKGTGETWWASPPQGLWRAMGTARGKSVLNLAAHTCTCCLTFAQLSLVWHSRNYGNSKFGTQIRDFP